MIHDDGGGAARRALLDRLRERNGQTLAELCGHAELRATQMARNDGSR